MRRIALFQINVAANKAISVFKKRDDRRRATHNEVESKSSLEMFPFDSKLIDSFPLPIHTITQKEGEGIK